MSQNKIHRTLLQALNSSDRNLEEVVSCLVNPVDEQQLKRDSIIIFNTINRILNQIHKIQIQICQRIAQLSIMLVMAGHYHILHLINSYYLQHIVALCTGVSKFNPVCPENIEEIESSAIKWKKQFACQFVNLLASWFPRDVVSNDGESKYARIVKGRGIVIKGYFILNYSFIKNIQKKVQAIEHEQGKICQYCVQFCYNLIQKNHPTHLSTNPTPKPYQSLNPITPKLNLYEKLKKQKAVSHNQNYKSLHHEHEPGRAVLQHDRKKQSTDCSSVEDLCTRMRNRIVEVNLIYKYKKRYIYNDVRQEQEELKKVVGQKV